MTSLQQEKIYKKIKLLALITRVNFAVFSLTVQLSLALTAQFTVSFHKMSFDELYLWPIGLVIIFFDNISSQLWKEAPVRDN